MPSWGSVEFVDGTGSGDAFVSGYIHGLLHGESVPRCLELGSALGASCVQAVGATTSVFRAAELANFVREHPLDLSVMLHDSPPMILQKERLTA